MVIHLLSQYSEGLSSGVQDQSGQHRRLCQKKILPISTQMCTYIKYTLRCTINICVLHLGTPVILATWGAERGRFMVLGQPGAKKFLRPTSQRNKAGHSGMCLSYTTVGSGPGPPGPKSRPYLQNKQSDKNLEVWLKQYLPHKHEPQSSNSSTAKKKFYVLYWLYVLAQF
jgi:hypothetical protein